MSFNFGKTLLAVSLLGLSAQAFATTLTFDIAGGVSDHENIPQTYGDAVSASPDGLGHSYGVGAEGFTPNVTVEYGTTGEDPALWTTGYGDLTNIYFNDADGDTTLTVTFTADAGWDVDLYGFDMASFFAAGQTVQAVSVLDIGNATTLFSQGATLANGVTSTNFTFATPLSASKLAIVVDLTGLGSVSDDVGLDNIRYGQTLAVPEAETYAMMLAGLGLVGYMARRRTLNQ
jgi:hypothetical protein